MNKIINLFITALMCLFFLSSCADGIMKEYDDDDIGLHYELPSSLKYYKYPEYPWIEKTYKNKAGTVTVTIDFASIEDILASGVYSRDFTLEDYINHTIEVDELGDINVNYNAAKTRATFDLIISESEDDAGGYIYFTFIKNENGIYMVQMACYAAIYEDYAPQFAKWSNFIRAY